MKVRILIKTSYSDIFKKLLQEYNLIILSQSVPPEVGYSTLIAEGTEDNIDAMIEEYTSSTFSKYSLTYRKYEI